MTINQFVTDVEAVSVRDLFNGEESSQIELAIRTKAGTLAVRLISRRNRVIRVTDLRARDRKNRKTPFVSVPSSELVKP